MINRTDAKSLALFIHWNSTHSKTELLQQLWEIVRESKDARRIMSIARQCYLSGFSTGYDQGETNLEAVQALNTPNWEKYCETRTDMYIDAEHDAFLDVESTVSAIEEKAGALEVEAGGVQ